MLLCPILFILKLFYLEKGRRKIIEIDQKDVVQHLYFLVSYRILQPATIY